jgi:acid phosphatase
VFALGLVLMYALKSRGSVLATPDHVVIVFEENHSYSSVIGNPAAPYINSLASAGQSFTNFFAISHPSQPNYIQFFSGVSNGVYDNVTPPDAPFSTPNLGAALINAGGTFTGYNEDLPYAGYTGDASGNYVRRHNGPVNWQNDVNPTPSQLPSSLNQPFSAFPTTPAGFAALPSVSIVVPNLQNDMHDGTIAQADLWLSNNIDPYRAWADTHNSLLIVTWDEDDHTQNNQIPTIFVGPMVRSGAPAVAAGDNWNLHSLLRTVGDFYGASPPGAAANVAPITGVWTNEPPQPQFAASFQRGTGGYTDTRDTYIESANPNTAHATAAVATTDGLPLSVGLLRFDDIIGVNAGQVMPGSTVLRAKLTITTGTTANDQSAATMAIHRMLRAWAESDTWTTLLNGVGPDGVEAAAIPDNALTPELLGTSITFDVTGTLQAWVSGAPNHGWLINPSGTDGWRWNTADSLIANLRPKLEVSFIPEPTAMPMAAIVVAFRQIRRRKPR